MNKTRSPILKDPSLMFLLNCFLSSIFLRFTLLASSFLFLNYFSSYFSRSYFYFCSFCSLVSLETARRLALVVPGRVVVMIGTGFGVVAGGTIFEFYSFIILRLEISSSLISSSWSMFYSTYVLKIMRSLMKSAWVLQIF